jgi:hypothetical protein
LPKIQDFQRWKKDHSLGFKIELLKFNRSLCENRKVEFKVETLLSRGRVVIENGEHKGKARRRAVFEARNLREDLIPKQ